MRVASFFGGLTSLEEVQENLQASLRETFLDSLPGAILRTGILLLCYVSLILAIGKKRHEVAVCVICGASVGECAGLATLMLFLTTVPAGLFALGYIFLMPSYEMRSYVQGFDPSLRHFVRNGAATLTVIVYFVVMLLLAGGMVRHALRRHSPIEYLRETGE